MTLRLTFKKGMPADAVGLLVVGINTIDPKAVFDSDARNVVCNITRPNASTEHDYFWGCIEMVEELVELDGEGGWGILAL